MGTENLSGAALDFQRIFMIFANEDEGYEAGRKPSGYVRLEVRNGRGKLYAAVQNLRPGNGKFIYKLYLLSTGGSRIMAAYAGELKPELNKAVLEWSFDSQNVGNSGVAAGGFDVAAVLAEHSDHRRNAVICPLAAYKGVKREWRSGLKALLLGEKSAADGGRRGDGVMSMKEEHQNGRPCMQKADDGPAATDVGQSGNKSIMHEDQNLWQEYIMPELEPEEDEAAWQNTRECESGGDAANSGHQGRAEDRLGQYGAEGQTCGDGIWRQTEARIEPDHTDGEDAPEQTETGTDSEQAEAEMALDRTKREDSPGQTETGHVYRQPYRQYQTSAGEIDTGCVYLNGNMCDALINNGTLAANPCAACPMHGVQPRSGEPSRGDVSQLRMELDRYFVQCDPFHSNRSDYTWWRVSNPVNLNNILYQCNIRSPLLFNPAVMMAHYKYRHLIVGIFHHKAKEKHYVVCGVPGMSMVDKKPFGDMSKWVQAEGNRIGYGAFGYWLVYVDPDGGKILNPNRS